MAVTGGDTCAKGGPEVWGHPVSAGANWHQGGSRIAWTTHCVTYSSGHDHTAEAGAVDAPRAVLLSVPRVPLTPSNPVGAPDQARPRAPGEWRNHVTSIPVSHDPMLWDATGTSSGPTTGFPTT